MNGCQIFVSSNFKNVDYLCLQGNNQIMRFLLVSFLISLSSILQAQTEKLTIRDITATGKTYAKGVSGIRHMLDGNHYSVMDGGKVIKYSYADASFSEVLFDQSAAKSKGMAYNMDNYQISKSGERLLIQTNTRSVYRHSKMSTYYLWDFANETLTQIFDGKQVFYATLSPDEDKVAFVFENNLYLQSLIDGKVTQITKDGEQNKVLNGMTDWVYEEEFAFIRAFEWSPEGDFIAFVRFDESEVKQYEIPVYVGRSYPYMYEYKYPKAGEDNSVVNVKIYNVAKGQTVDADLGTEKDIYIPRIKWINENELCITRLNRLQNHLELLKADAAKGKTKVFYEEKSMTYIDITDDLTFLDGGKSFIISSEQDGYNNLYHFSMKGKLINIVAKGKYDVTEFLGYDDENKVLYYQSAEESPLERHLYKVNLDGTNKKMLVQGDGTHEASFSKNFKYYLHTFSNINTPPVISVRDNNNEVVRVLESNEDFAKSWSEFAGLPFEFFTVKAADGETDLNAWKVEPEGFDANKEYPLLMFVYGGPGSQMVKNTWYTSNKAWFQYLAQQGYYVICVDNRGTGARGVDFKKCTYKNLGQIEVEDQIAAAEQFAKLPYIDADRIGMFGWSYGGFMTSHCLARSKVFKTGVAVAPVTSWEYYDNIYTERYMQRPQDNEAGYDNTRVMKFAEGLRDKNYLLVHGSFDDNVHPQNAFELMNTLVQMNIPFDSEIYVNKNHGIYGGLTRLHLYTKMTEFLDENLKGE
jgi:dipeptidyl-peptidase-4